MEILWWWAPPAVVTVLAMGWVSWVSREGYGDVDPEVAARRLGKALAKQPKLRRTTSARRVRQPATGVAAVRSTTTGQSTQSHP